MKYIGAHVSISGGTEKNSVRIPGTPYLIPTRNMLQLLAEDVSRCNFYLDIELRYWQDTSGFEKLLIAGEFSIYRYLRDI